MKQVKFTKTNIELNDAYRKVLYWFFSYPTKEASLNDLVKCVNVSKTTAHRIVNYLIKEEFLKVDVLGKLWRIRCNQKHLFNTTKKVTYNLELIYESKIIDAILKNVPQARSIILFGSYRKGDDTENSDIDIAVETLDNKEVHLTTLGTIPTLGYRKDVAVNILQFNRNKVDLNLFANLVNGIVLYGFLEARP